MTKESRFRLDPREVRGGYGSGAASPFEGRAPEERQSLLGFTVWMEHDGTGIRVEGRLPDGEYAVRQIRLLEVELRKSLFAELELKVARRLGRQA